MEYIYPAIFYPCERKKGFTVEIPNLPGCVSEGESLEDAMDMAVDAASGWLLDEIEDGNPIPLPSKVEDIHPEPGGIVKNIFIRL